MKDLRGIVPVPQNSEKLNQESKKALRELNQTPDETGLYCLQLAEWSLKNSLDDPDGRLTTTLEEMKGWHPADVMNYLEREPETNEPKDAVDWNLVNNDPKELADQILLAIHDNLTLTLPCYPQRRRQVYMKEKTPLPKKTSTPLKSILEKLSSSAENAMRTTYKPPKKGKKEV